MPYIFVEDILMSILLIRRISTHVIHFRGGILMSILLIRRISTMSYIFVENILMSILLIRRTIKGFLRKKKKKKKMSPQPSQSIHSCTQHVISPCSTFLQSIIKIFRKVFVLQSRHKIRFK